MFCGGYIGDLVISTCPDASYIYSNLTLRKELLIRNILHRLLLSSFHPHSFSEVSRNFYSLIPSLVFPPLTVPLSSSAIFCNPDTVACFLPL